MNHVDQKSVKDFGLSNLKRKKRRNLMQVIMESEKAELPQECVGKKRKKLDARAFKALFKRQRIKEVFPADVNRKIEGPDNSFHTRNGNDGAIKSMPNGEAEGVSDRCCKRSKGNMRHLSIDKASGGDCEKSISNLGGANVDSNYNSNVLDESSVPLAAGVLTDSRTDSITRKFFDGSERFPTGCSTTGITNASKSGSADCLDKPLVDPGIIQVEVAELQRTQVPASKGGPSTVTASNLSESLQVDSSSMDDDPNPMSGQSSLGKGVGTGNSDERFSLLSKQNNHHDFLRGEMRRLCQILKLSEDATSRVREFLEYVIKHHDVNRDSAAIVQAFLLAVCWVATSISKQKVDKQDSFISAKMHLNYQCSEKQVWSIYSKIRTLKLMYLQSSENTCDSGKDGLLADERSRKQPSCIINGASLFSLSNLKNVKIEIEEIVQSLLQQKLGITDKASGSDLDDKIARIKKKCVKRMKKLVRKQEEEMHGLLKTWEDEKEKLEKDHKLESAVIRCIYGEGLVRTLKLNVVDDKFAKKMEEHNLMKDFQLNNLKDKQLAARSEESQKIADQLAEAVPLACTSELRTENGPRLFGLQSEDGARCSELGTQITNTLPQNVATTFQEQSGDQNPSKEVCLQGKDVAPSDIPVSTPAETALSDGLLETTGNLDIFSSPKDVEVISLERSPEIAVWELNQPNQSSDTTEKIGFPVCGEPISDELGHIEMNQDPIELTRPVSDEIAGHVDPVEFSNTSNLGDPVGLPNTDANQRDEPGESTNSSLLFHKQPLVRSEEILSSPDCCDLSKQHVSQDEIHQTAYAELEDRGTPAAETQNTSRTEVANLEHGDSVTLAQSNHAVTVTGNCEMLHHFSVDASRICYQSPSPEIVRPNGDLGTNSPQTFVAGETEELSHELVSQPMENLHSNHMDLGQESRLSHELSLELSVCAPENTVMAEAAVSTELPNQSDPELGTGHLHEHRNNDEITRSISVHVFQDEIHQIASAELEDREAPTAETQDTSHTDIATLEHSETLTLVQPNHAVPVTGNTDQLHPSSIDGSLFCNQPPLSEIEDQNRNQGANFSQTVAAGETEELAHEFVSNNLHHNHLDLGQASRVSERQSVDSFVRSPDNTVAAEAVNTTEIPNQSAPQLGRDGGHLPGANHLIHPTHQITYWYSTPSLLAEPLQNELEKLRKEAEQLKKKQENVITQLKSDCEKEIKEIINEIRAKYDVKLKDAEAEFRFKKNELEKIQNLVNMNRRLAEAFRFKFRGRDLRPSRPPGLQQAVLPSSFVQQMQQLSQPPVRTSPLASAGQTPPTQQTSAPSAQALNQLFMPISVASSRVAIPNDTVPLSMQAVQLAGPFPVASPNVTVPPPMQAVQRVGSSPVAIPNATVPPPMQAVQRAGSSSVAIPHATVPPAMQAVQRAGSSSIAIQNATVPPPMQAAQRAGSSHITVPNATLPPPMQGVQRAGYSPVAIPPVTVPQPTQAVQRAGSSPVAIPPVTVPQPTQAVQRAGSVLSPGTSTRPPVIGSLARAVNPRVAEFRSRAPHLQPSRPAASPSIAPSSLPATSRSHPQPFFPSQLATTPRPRPPAPLSPQSHLMPNIVVSQNVLEPQGGQPFHFNLPQPGIELPRDMNRHAHMNHTLPPLSNVDSTMRSLEPSDVALSNVPSNPGSSAMDAVVIYLSDEE